MLKKLLKRVIRKLVYGHASDSNSFVNYLKQIGCTVGCRVHFFDPANTTIDLTRPWLLTIGNDVNITRGVTILTHGYDWSVMQGKYNDILGSAGAVSIGNNVFIGMNATILKGVHIGNNVIIGACSLVTKDIPDNVVVAGVPAKVIMTLDEYHEKREKAQQKEATELVQLYFKKYGKMPEDEALHEFFWLFENDPKKLPVAWKKMMCLHGNEAQCNEAFISHKRLFGSKESFFNSIMMK